MEQSMQKSGYICKGISARTTGVNLEKNTYIQEKIEQERLTIFDKSKITEEYILEGLSKIALEGTQEANRVRSWELLGKYKAMFTDKTVLKGDMTLSPSQEAKIEEYITNRLTNVPMS